MTTYASALMPAVEAVRAYRQERTAHYRKAAASLDVALPGAGPLDARSYASAHHFVYAIKAELARDHEDRVPALVESWRRAVRGAGAALFLDGRVEVVAASACERVLDDRYESPMYLAVRGAGPLTPNRVEPNWDAAVVALSAAALDTLPREVTGIVVQLEHRGATETTNSYTVRALPGTIAIDHVDDPVRLGELLLHESAHTFLNDLLDATKAIENADASARWFSPWKNEYRPAYGIVHAGFAFGLLQRYFEFHATSDSEGGRYACVRAEIGAEQRAAARDAVLAATTEVSDDRVRSLLLEIAD